MAAEFLARFLSSERSDADLEAGRTFVMGTSEADLISFLLSSLESTASGEASDFLRAVFWASSWKESRNADIRWALLKKTCSMISSGTVEERVAKALITTVGGGPFLAGNDDRARH
jgi:hypothetical protein